MVFKVYSMEIDTFIIIGDASVGLETNFFSVDTVSSVDISSIRFQDISGFGLIYSPASIHFKENGYFATTILNLKLYYSFFRNKHIVLGPFAGIHAAGINRLDFCEFTTGLLFLFNAYVDMFNNNHIPLFFEIVQVQIGYKYYSKKNAFYAQIGFDLFGFLLATIDRNMDKTTRDSFTEGVY
jgi:hypothetical protein